MKNRIFFWLPLVLILLTAVACKKSEYDEIEFGYDYFPLEKGHYVEYEVLEIFHDEDLLPKHDTIRYKLKTVIGENVLDNLGRDAKKYFRYSYDINTGDLLDHRVWTTIIDDGKRGEVVEENQRRIRLVFPLRVDEEWNVNAYNTDEEQNVYVEEEGTPKVINGIVLENTAKIFYDDFLSLVDYRKKYEIYAKGVGLVERSFKDFYIADFDTTKIKKGWELHYRLLDYGTE